MPSSAVVLVLAAASVSSVAALLVDNLLHMLCHVIPSLLLSMQMLFNCLFAGYGGGYGLYICVCYLFVHL
jgi:hypothetical protein